MTAVTGARASPTGNSLPYVSTDAMSHVVVPVRAKTAKASGTHNSGPRRAASAARRRKLPSSAIPPKVMTSAQSPASGAATVGRASNVTSAAMARHRNAKSSQRRIRSCRRLVSDRACTNRRAGKTIRLGFLRMAKWITMGIATKAKPPKSAPFSHATAYAPPPLIRIEPAAEADTP